MHPGSAGTDVPVPGTPLHLTHPVRLVIHCPHVLPRALCNTLVPATRPFPELVSCSSKSVKTKVGVVGASNLQPVGDNLDLSGA